MLVCEEGYTIATIASALASCLPREDGEVFAAELVAIADLIIAIYARQDCCSALNKGNENQDTIQDLQ